MNPDQLSEYIKCAKDPVYFFNTYGYVFDMRTSQVGRLTCFPYQEDYIRQLHLHKNNIVLKSRQCIPEDVFVDTPNGPKAIQDFKVGDSVYSYNFETNSAEVDSILDSWYSGEKKCVKIKLKDSRNVEVGESHPFYIKNKGWIKAKDLSVNDEILDVNIGFGNISANEDVIKILGYLITDGHTKKQVKFTNNNPFYLQEFEESIIRLFPELKIKKYKKSEQYNGYDYFPVQKHGSNNKNPIMKWCENMGISNKCADEKVFSKEIFAWDKKSVSILINRCFAGDGWISIVKKKNARKRLELGICSPSVLFLEQIKMLLKKYNIKSNIYESKNMKLQKNRFYKLRITHSKSIIRFINEIGIYKKINDEHLWMIKNYKHDVKDIPIVRKVVKTDIKKCYDISVTKNENFLINGLVVHNTGMSVMTAGYIAWKLIFNSDEKILIIANKAESAVRFLDTVKQFLDNLPIFLLPSQRLEQNTKKIRFSNGSWVKASASSEDAGRGESLTMLVLDETAFIENAEGIWMSAGTALAATNGKCVMISCVTKDTYVFTDNGLKQMKDFIKSEEVGPYIVENYNVLGKNKLRKGNIIHNNGKVKTKRIFTTNSNLESSLNHKLWACKDGNYDWYQMKDLKVGDYVSIQYGHETWGKNDDTSNFKYSSNGKIKNVFCPKKITKDIAYLIGLYIAEGSVYKKINKKGKFVGGIVTITCGDNISNAIKNAGLTYGCYDGLHYCIQSKNFIEYLEYLGFDISKRAKYKEIPSRLLEMSRENIVYMLRGFFDGDGTSRKNRGWVSTVSSSINLIQQVRMLLLNLGILTDYTTGITAITKKVQTTSVYHRIEMNGYFSNVFYNKIGFGFERKQDNKKYLNNKNLHRNTMDVIPYSAEIIKKVLSYSKHTTYSLLKEKIHTTKIINNKVDLKHVSRDTMLRFYKEVKNELLADDLLFFEKNICENLKWNKIIKIEESENETYDFSLPETEDFWSHSVIYNGILGHQTPKGSGNLYHKTWIAANKGEMDFNPIKIHWTQHPIFSLDMEEKTDEFGKKYVTSPWYDRECERMQHDKIKISQELDLSFEGSQAVVIDNHVIVRYEKDIEFNKIKPICYFDYKSDGAEGGFVDYKTPFTVWEKPKEEENFIISADVGRGDGSDYSTIEIINADTFVQVAEYQGKVPPDIFAYIIHKAALDYNNAFVAIECNSFGLATCLTLKNQIKYDSDRIYHSKSAKKIFNRTNNFVVDQDAEIPGFQTTTKTRPLLMSCLGKHMRDGQIKINSTRLLDEFKTFVYNGDKPEHAQGYHDDLIFAFAIALFMRDTEFENVFNSKAFYKAMIDGISRRNTNIKEKLPPIENSDANNANRIKKQQFLDPFTGKPMGKYDSDDDDLTWLYGDIKSL